MMDERFAELAAGSARPGSSHSINAADIDIETDSPESTGKQSPRMRRRRSIKLSHKSNSSHRKSYKRRLGDDSWFDLMGRQRSVSSAAVRKSASNSVVGDSESLLFSDSLIRVDRNGRSSHNKHTSNKLNGNNSIRGFVLASQMGPADNGRNKRSDDRLWDNIASGSSSREDRCASPELFPPLPPVAAANMIINLDISGSSCCSSSSESNNNNRLQLKKDTYSSPVKSSFSTKFREKLKAQRFEPLFSPPPKLSFRRPQISVIHSSRESFQSKSPLVIHDTSLDENSNEAAGRRRIRAEPVIESAPNSPSNGHKLGDESSILLVDDNESEMVDESEVDEVEEDGEKTVTGEGKIGDEMHSIDETLSQNDGDNIGDNDESSIFPTLHPIPADVKSIFHRSKGEPCVRGGMAESLKIIQRNVQSDYWKWRLDLEEKKIIPGKPKNGELIVRIREIKSDYNSKRIYGDIIFPEKSLFSSRTSSANQDNVQDDTIRVIINNCGLHRVWGSAKLKVNGRMHIHLPFRRAALNLILNPPHVSTLT